MAAGHLEALEERTLLSTAYPLDTTRWTPLGPAAVNFGSPGGASSSGRLTGIAADPADPRTIYVAAAGGGVWKTTDGGTHWTPLTDNQASLFMGAIAIAPGDHNVLYAGEGEANNSGDSDYGHGILVSRDAGATWTLTTAGGAFERRTVSKIAVDPTNPAVAYAAVADFALNGIYSNTGIWKTTDYGANWANTTAARGLTNNTPYSDVVVNPANPQVVYAAIGGYDGEAANGVIKSTDGGSSWNYVGGTLPSGMGVGRISIAIAPSSPGVLYAALAAGFNGGTFGNLLGMYRSADGGATWTQETNTPEYMAGQGWYNNILAVDPADPNVVYAGGSTNFNAQGIIESRDGGASWFEINSGTDFKGPHTDHHALTFDSAGRLLDGNDGGIARLENPVNGQVLWSDLNGDLQTIQFTGIATDPSNPNVAYGGSQDNGTEKFTGSRPWTQVRGGDGGFTRVDRTNPATVYHTYTGVSLERSDDGGQTWVGATNGITPDDHSEFYAPYILDPANQARVLFGATHLWESTNKGGNYRAIGGPGSTGWTSTKTIGALATSGNTVYAATDDDKIFATTDDGANWTNVTPTGAVDPGGNIRFRDMVLDPADPRVVYAVADQFSVAHVIRSTDGGASWTDLSGNLPDLPTESITLGVVGGVQTVYVGNDDGVYATPSAAISWSRLGSGFPRAQVSNLDFDATAGLLAAGTHGRGMFELSIQGTPQTGKGAAVDNTTFGYRDYGAGWATVNGAGVGGSYRVHAAAAGAEYAVWTLSRPAGGTYQVFTTWVADPANATNAAYKVYNGGTLLATVAANQQARPGTLSMDGTPYLSLGTYAFSTGVLRVILTDAANGNVVADQVYAAYPDPAFTGTPSGTAGAATPPPQASYPDGGTMDPAPLAPPSGAPVIATAILPSDGGLPGAAPLALVADGPVLGSPPGRRKAPIW